MQDSIILQGKKFISARRAAQISNYSADYIGQLCRAKKIESKIIGRTWYVCEESLFMHRIGILKEKVEKSKNVTGQSEQKILLETANIASQTIIRDIPKEVSSKKTFSFIVTIFVVLFIFGSVIFIGFKNTGLVSDKVANTSSAMNSVTDFLYRGWKSLSLFFGYEIKVAEHSQTDLPDPSEGMVVIPSVGSKSKNELLVKSIKDSFSDEVSVTMDDSGMTGVITPEFRDKQGKDYLYVMVPVKGSRGP